LGKKRKGGFLKSRPVITGESSSKKEKKKKCGAAKGEEERRLWEEKEVFEGKM